MGDSTKEPKTMGEIFQSVGGWMNGGELGYPSFGSMSALRVFVDRSIRAYLAAQPAEGAGQAGQVAMTYTVDGIVMSPLEYIDYLHTKLNECAVASAERIEALIRDARISIRKALVQPVAARELDVEADPDDMADEFLTALRDNGGSPDASRINGVFHDDTLQAMFVLWLAARNAAQGAQPESAPVSTEQAAASVQNQNPGI